MVETWKALQGEIHWDMGGVPWHHSHGRSHGTSHFCLYCFQCYILLNKNFVLQSISLTVFSSVWMDVPLMFFLPFCWHTLYFPWQPNMILCVHLSSEGKLKSGLLFLWQTSQPRLSLNLHISLVAKSWLCPLFVFYVVNASQWEGLWFVNISYKLGHYY